MRWGCLFIVVMIGFFIAFIATGHLQFFGIAGWMLVIAVITGIAVGGPFTRG